MFEFRTLGTLSLQGPEGREVASVLAQPKRVALLAYLASTAAQGFHRRDELLALFWPERDQEHARSALRKSLHFLRHALGDGVIVTRGAEEVGVDPAVLRCDAVMFETLLRQGLVGEALQWYGGTFLTGFHLSRCLQFERWMENERSRWRERAAQAAWSLAQAAETTGRPHDAAAWARRAAGFSPDDEALICELIRLLERVGDGAGAMHLYDAFARRLKEDHDAEPAPETRAAMLAVRERAAATEAQRPAAHASPEPSAPASPRRHHWKPTAGLNGKTLVFASLGAAAVALLVTAIGLPVVGRSTNAPAPLKHRVVVAPFENRTGDSLLGPIGGIVADWITEGLAQTSIAEIIALPTVLRAFQAHDRDGDPAQRTAGGRALAAAVGASTVIWGSYYRNRDELTIHAQVTDGERGTVLGVIGPVRTSVAAVGDALETLRQRVMGLLAVHFDDRLAPWAADIRQPPLYQAYAEYVQGLEAATFDEKSHHFVRATDIDPSFVRAWLEALVSYPDTQSSRDWDAWADSGFAILRRSRDTMSPADRHHLDAVEAVRRRDWQGFYAATRRASSYAPDKRPDFAVAAFNLGRYREMVDVWLSKETPAILRPPDPVATKQVTAALHFLGEHERELELARLGKREHPGHINFYEMETNALVALGRVAEVEAAVEEALSSGPPSGWYSPAVFLLTVGNELLWHGYDAAARQFLERAEALQRRVVERGQRRPVRLPGPSPWRQVAADREKGNKRALATVLLFLGRWDAAQRIFREVYAQGGPPEDLASVGIAAARSGRQNEALRVMQELERLRWSSSWELSWYQAYVAGALEDCELMAALLKRAFAEGALHQYLHRRLGFYYCRNDPAFVALAKPRG